MDKQTTRTLAQMVQSIGELRIVTAELLRRIEALERIKYQTPQEHAEALKARRGYPITSILEPHYTVTREFD